MCLGPRLGRLKQLRAGTAGDPRAILALSKVCLFCCCMILCFRASLIAQLVKNSPAVQETSVQFPGSGLGRSPEEGIGYPLQYSWASLVAQLVKNPPAVQETWVQSLDWEDSLEKGKASHSTILAWIIPYSPWGCKELNTTERLSLSLSVKIR